MKSEKEIRDKLQDMKLMNKVAYEDMKELTKIWIDALEWVLED